MRGGSFSNFILQVTYARVHEINTNKMCVVDFEDGTSTNDSFLTDIVACDCGARRRRDDATAEQQRMVIGDAGVTDSALCARGMHVKGAIVTLRWPDDGRCETGRFKRSYKATVYHVSG